VQPTGWQPNHGRRSGGMVPKATSRERTAWPARFDFSSGGSAREPAFPPLGPIAWSATSGPMIGPMGSRIASPDLIGREDEIGAISKAFQDAKNGHGRTVLIGGEAGIGKSRVLNAVLDDARAQGATVLVGGCFGLAEGALPFAPIVEAIRPLLGDAYRAGRDGAAVLGRPVDSGRTEAARAAAGSGGRGSAALAEVADASTAKATEAGELDDAVLGVAAELGLLARHQTADAAAAELRPDWARSQLYETFLRLLRRLAVRAPVVLAIEDLHWGGDSTRELLAFLVRNARTERLLLLITFRSDELHRRHPLLFWLGEVDRSPGVERIELARLGRPALVQQLSGILGHRPDQAMVESIYERSEGNPFFAEELVAAGAERGALPPTLREVLAARLAHVSEPTLRLLGVAAVAGRSVDHDLLLAVSELSEEELDEALGEAMSAQLLVAGEPARGQRAAGGRYSFRHALLAEAAAETVLPGRRRRLHGAIAQVLSESNGLRGAEEAGRLVEIAHHWFEARELGNAFAASLRAGDAAQASGAYSEALRQYERAVELCDIVPAGVAETEMDRIELLRRTAHTAQLSGEHARAIQLLHEAVDLAQGRGQPVLEGLLYERLGRSLWTSADFAGAERAYRRAIELVPEQPPSADRARVLAGYAQVLMLAGHHKESLPFGRRALELARETGTRQLEGHALATIGADLGFMGDPDGGAVLTRQAIAIAEEIQDFDDIGRGYACHSSTLALAGRHEEALAFSLEGSARMRDLGMGATYGAFLAMNASDELTYLGRWDEALALTSEVRPIARGTSRVFATGQAARLLTLRGEFEPAAGCMADLSRLLGQAVEAQFNGPIAATQIELCALTGDTAGGRRVADRVLPVLGQTEDGGLQALVLVAAMRHEVGLAERAAATRDTSAVKEAAARARGYLEAIRRLAGGLEPGARHLELERSVLIAEAEASRLGAGPDPQKWRRALEAARTIGPVYETVYAAYRLAEALLPDRAAKDEAASLLAEAYEGACRLGARPLRESIAALATRARVALPVVVGPVVAPASEDGSGGVAGSSDRGLAAYGLSDREVEVLRLLAAGRTNRQIGQALFISESTAGVHVSHILTKLRVTGRVEAATIAARIGLTG
jgi:DNA-binding NarL/FixJ family response regulator